MGRSRLVGTWGQAPIRQRRGITQQSLMWRGLKAESEITAILLEQLPFVMLLSLMRMGGPLERVKKRPASQIR